MKNHAESCKGEHCVMCLPKKVDATHKVGEEILHDDPLPMRHNLTAYVCCAHFKSILGAGGMVHCGGDEDPVGPAATPVLQDLLGLVLPRVPTSRIIDEWTLEQREAAEAWAAATHLAASDNDDVKVPPMPEFLKKYDKPPPGIDEDLSIWPKVHEVDE